MVWCNGKYYLNNIDLNKNVNKSTRGKTIENEEKKDNTKVNEQVNNNNNNNNNNNTDNISITTGGWIHRPEDTGSVDTRNGDPVEKMINIETNEDFYLLFGGQGTAVLGDMAATGDSALYVSSQDTDNYSGPLYSANTKYSVMDHSFLSLTSDPSKKNASTAKLDLPTYVKGKHIVWAGLFWQGHIHEQMDSGIPGQTSDLTTSRVDDRVKDRNKINFKTPDGVTHQISAPYGVHDKNSSTYHYAFADKSTYYPEFANYRIRGSGDSFHFFYGCYKDVTNLVKNSYTPTHNTFTVGNILTSSGTDFGDFMYNNHPKGGELWTSWSVRMGFFGGWSLVVVYDLSGTDESNNNQETYKNVSVFNGYDEFTIWDDHKDISFIRTIDIDGFKTPKNGIVKSKLLIFGGGGDPSVPRDTLQIQNKTSGTFADLINNKNPSRSQFNNTYSNMGIDMVPEKPHHHGMDLDIFDVSSFMDNNQNSTKINFGVEKTGLGRQANVDELFPQAIGFSTQLYIPRVCYDYAIRYGHSDASDADKERHFKFSWDEKEDLTINILIRSEESDFDYTNTTLMLQDLNMSKLVLKNAKISPSNLNGYRDATIISHTPPNIGFGDNDDNASDGGTIGAEQLQYGKFILEPKMDTGDLNESFKISLSTNIDFGVGDPTPYEFITGTGQFPLERCEVNMVYNPLKGILNVERTDSASSNTLAKKYSLYTQIAGRDFNISVVSYNPASPSAEFSIKNIGAELELFNAAGFENSENSGFDSLCNDLSEESIIMQKMITFPNTETKRINVNNFRSDIALRSAAFRLKYLTDKSNQIIKTDCYTSQNINQCFANNVYSNYASGGGIFGGMLGGGGANSNSLDPQAICKNACESSSGYSNGEGCYDCLKNNYGKVLCSRDNFAIRPETFRLAIADNNQTDKGENGAPTPLVAAINNSSQNYENFTAGYTYRLDANATLFGSDTSAGGYKGKFRSAASNGNSAKLAFNGSVNGVNCADNSDKILNVSFWNGKTSNVSNQVKSNNVGSYLLTLEDQNWTYVDQKGSSLKPYPSVDDCILSSSDVSSSGEALSGCLIQSNYNATHTALNLFFVPDHFDLSAVSLERSPSGGNSWIYMSNMSLPNPMALATLGSVVAKGADDANVSNFTSGCVANDINITVNFSADRELGELKGSLRKRTIFQEYLLASKGIDSSGIAINTPMTNIVYDFNTTDTNLTTHIVGFSKTNFDDLDPGSAELKLYYNFQRSNDDPVNPVKLLVKDIAASAPAAKAHAHMKEEYTPQGINNYDQNFTFLYGRIESSKYFYDNITSSSVNTPLSIRVFCNLGYDTCKEKGILTYITQTNNASWWKSKDHQIPEDGKIGFKLGTPLLEGRGSPSINKHNFTIDFDGEDKAVFVLSGNAPTTPMTVPIILETTSGVGNQTSNWLIFNAESSTAAPNPFYKVRFVDINSSWTGVGETGKTIGTKEKINKNERVSW